MRSFDELRANTVMIAVVEPSEAMDVALDVAVSDAGTTVGVVVVVPVVPVVPEVPEVPVVDVAVSPVIDLDVPPQPAARTPSKTIIDNLRIVIP